MQLDQIILTKTEMIRYCELFRHGGKMLSTHITNDLAHFSVPAEDESQQSATFTHALNEPTLVCLIMPLADRHFRTHFKSNKLKHKQQKKASTSPNSSTKDTNN
jgi:hypothetical protein